MPSRIIATTEIINAEGKDYMLQVGVNRDGRRALMVLAREHRGQAYLPVIEMDVDILSFYRDGVAGFNERPKDDDDPNT